ncbi:MAG: hypothetical protein O2931_07920 [Planctomycetota bacterium]|nr:hypothetical protein [Planctomycetota bacterium]
MRRHVGFFGLEWLLLAAFACIGVANLLGSQVLESTSMQCTYDIHESWETNCERGPAFAEAPPEVPWTPIKSFLGLPVRSRIGIAAGLLPNSRWVLPYAERGFDILTYKTVRSVARPCYPVPNWVFVDDLGPDHTPAYVIETVPADPIQISSSVCFGMPSFAPAFWREDIRRCRSGLSDGQVLIVSGVATPPPNPTIGEMAADYAQCAAWAVAAGADVIEANLSCPNVCSAEGTLYHDATSSRSIVQQIRDAIGNTPLLLKLGVFPNRLLMQQFLRAVDGLAEGVTLVNCISRTILQRDGQPAFGPNHTTAGVLGRAIHQPSVEAVREIHECITDEGLALAVVAVGGVAQISDFADFFQVGAHAVLCGSSPMYLPNLAVSTKQLHPEW